MNLLKRLARDRTGATAIEYALIAALVAVGSMVGLQQLGTTTADTFNSVQTTVAAANSSA